MNRWLYDHRTRNSIGSILRRHRYLAGEASWWRRVDLNRLVDPLRDPRTTRTNFRGNF